MPGHPREMIISAERRFPVRIRIGLPPGPTAGPFASRGSPCSKHFMIGVDSAFSRSGLLSDRGFSSCIGLPQWQKPINH